MNQPTTTAELLKAKPPTIPVPVNEAMREYAQGLLDNGTYRELIADSQNCRAAWYVMRELLEAGVHVPDDIMDKVAAELAPRLASIIAYEGNCHESAPAWSAAAREALANPTIPAPIPAPMPAKPKKFLFSRLTSQGAKVKVLHQIGRCAVAHITPAEPARSAYYVARWRQHHAYFGHLREAAAALAELRRLEYAEMKRDAERLTFAGAVEQLGVSESCLRSFCTTHGLLPDQDYTRAEVRRAVTSVRAPKMAVYLSLLLKLTPTPTTPA
ncbi:MAG: hypothetical protein NVS3B25_18910 [Hymenobacter sp.]